MRIVNESIRLCIGAALLHGLGACTVPAGEQAAPWSPGNGESASTAAPVIPDAGAAQPSTTGASPDAGAPSTAGSPGVHAAAPSGDLPCDVQQILGQRCGTCHGGAPAFGAPMSLAGLGDFKAAATTDASLRVAQLVKVRINASSKPMPPPSSSPLTDLERTRLNAWLDQGTPAGEPHCSETPGAPDPTHPGASVDVSGLDCHKFISHAEGDKSAKYKVGAAVDAYINMAFKAGWQGLGYAAVIRPVVDNAQAIHHWLLYEEAGADGLITPGIGQHPSGNMVAGWAPGGPIYDFRKFGDVGLELPGTSYVLELHYNSSDPSAEDASGVEICLMKSAPKNPVTNSWVGYDNWLLAGDFGGPRTTWTGNCAPISREPIHILYVTPHMHRAGRHMTSIINEPGGGKRTLHDAPFDFAYQTAYEKNEVLMPGETITTTCTFSEPKSFGQGTNEEMCYLFTYSYPKGALADNGAWGTFAHGEGVCLGQ